VPVLTVPADTVVELGMDMSPAATGQATAVEASSLPVTVTHADLPLERMERDQVALLQLDEVAPVVSVANLRNAGKPAFLFGPTPGVAGQFGRALDFDGGTDYVGLPPLDLNSNTVTISGWVKRRGTQDDFVGLVFNRYAETVAGLSLKSNGELRYHWRAQCYNFATGLVVPDYKWTFVALVVEPTKATVYMKDATGLHSAVNAVAHAPAAFAGETRLGSDVCSNSRYFRGMLDDIAIWNRALAPEEIAVLCGTVRPADNALLSTAQVAGVIFREWTATDSYGDKATGIQRLTLMHSWAPILALPAGITVNANESRLPARTGQATASDLGDGSVQPTYRDAVLEHLPGLAGYWPLDNGSTADLSGHRTEGTAKNGPASTAGKVGTAFQFNGSTQYVEGGAVNLANRSFTLSAWAKRSGTGRYDMILGQGSMITNLGLQFGFRSGNQFTFGFWHNDLDTDATYTDTEWNHWVGTYDVVSGARRIYRNGGELPGQRGVEDRFLAVQQPDVRGCARRGCRLAALHECPGGI
jgi:hypothetical protein